MRVLSVDKYYMSFKGTPVPCLVTIEYEQDEIDVDDYLFDSGDKDADKENWDKLEAGELLNLFVKVTMRVPGLDGLEGIDDLGGCIVSAIELKKGILSVVEDNEMLTNARNDLIKNITNVEAFIAKLMPKEA